MSSVLTLAIRNARRPRAYSTIASFLPVERISGVNILRFRETFFVPGIPVVLRGAFSHFPAIRKWFVPDSNDPNCEVLNGPYFEPFGDVSVPLEITQDVMLPRGEQIFIRTNAPLSSFIHFSRPDAADAGRVYLAQYPIADLPDQLQSDLPVPEIIYKAGKGDVYNSSIWLGLAPTYTPLHRDPNPNIFVQLAGSKVVRLMQPRHGLEVYERVRARIGGGGNPAMRGDEMMAGVEGEELEKEVWNMELNVSGKEDRTTSAWTGKRLSGFEAQLDRGDGIFIPSGWWHSIKGVGRGMIGSVSS